MSKLLRITTPEMHRFEGEFCSYAFGDARHMGNLERELNKYLFYEFSVDGEESSISETWPFTLRPLGNIEGRTVFEFDDDESFFALAGPNLNFLPKQGMSVDDLALQFVGSDWIAAHDPVSLDESRPREVDFHKYPPVRKEFLVFFDRTSGIYMI